MISYTEGYKYQLTERHKFNLGCRINDNLYPPDSRDANGFWFWKISPFLSVYPSGGVVQEIGYAWDGCSGPAIDDETNQVPGLEHDGGYQILRSGLLPVKPWRSRMDKRFKVGLKKRGMNFVRAWYYHLGIRLGGQDAAVVKREILTAE